MAQDKKTPTSTPGAQEPRLGDLTRDQLIAVLEALMRSPEVSAVVEATIDKIAGSREGAAEGA
ncbi:hypothetical protein OQA88_7061 [Cercophora sp. LCS_1]